MAIYADRVRETTTTTGTGAYALAGAASGFRTFVAGVGTGGVVTYCAEDGVNWEIGEGTVTDGAPDTLSRTTILASSNVGAAVVWGAGTKNIFLTATAGRLAYTDKANSFTGALTATQFNGSGAGLTAIPNGALTNSSLTIGTTPVSLGASSTTLAGLTSVASTSFTGALTGNASTASALQTARTINGISFNGSANIVVPTIYDSAYKAIINPGGGILTNTAGATPGAIAVTLPTATSAMLQITIKVYEYITGNSFEVHCGGYFYTVNNSWANNPFAYIVGVPTADRRFTVRFGFNGTNPVIYIGELASSWSYPQVYVTECLVGYSGQAIGYTAGWSIGYETTAFQSVTATLTGLQVGYATSTNTGNAVVLRDGAGNFSASTITAALSGTASNASALTIANDTATATPVYPVWSNSASGSQALEVTSTKLSFVPSTGVLSATQFTGSGAGLTSIPNGALTNSSITIGTTTVALGASSATLAGLTSVTATTFNGALNGNADTVTNGVYTTGDQTIGGNKTFSLGVNAPNFYDATGSNNVNLGSGGTEGRGLVAGYSGGSYGGIGHNVRHTVTGGQYVAPSTDTSSYLLFSGGGFIFQGAPVGAAGRTLSYATLAAISAAGVLSAVSFSGAGTGLTGIPNTALTNSSLTIGTTTVALGASSTTLAGLTSVTSTSFVGALTGNATNVTGTVAVANGGTGATTAAIARTNLSAAQSGANADITSLSGITGAIGIADSLQFDTAAAITVSPGQLAWNANDGTLDLGMNGGSVTQQIGLETYYRVKASSALANGQVAMATGTVGASGVITAAPATGLAVNDAHHLIGIATQDIALNGFGFITSFGLVRGINTTGTAVSETWVDGDVLYYNPGVAGGLTKVRPTAPNIRATMAIVILAATNGSLFVRPTFGSALGESDSNVQIGTLASNDFLVYNSTNQRWENRAATTALQSLGSLGSNVVAKSVAYTVIATDRGYVLQCTGTWTLTLTAAATLGVGFSFGLVNVDTGSITIDPNLAELVDGLATKVVLPGQSCFLVTDGIGWRTIGMSGGGATGGGSDAVFYENSQTITTDYTVASGKNAMSAGPITINTGITVTVPTGSVWTIV